MEAAGLFSLSMRAALPSASLAVYILADHLIPRLSRLTTSGHRIPFSRLPSPSFITAMNFLAICLAAFVLASFLRAAVSVRLLFHLASVAVPLLCWMRHCGRREVARFVKFTWSLVLRVAYYFVFIFGFCLLALLCIVLILFVCLLSVLGVLLIASLFAFGYVLYWSSKNGRPYFGVW